MEHPDVRSVLGIVIISPNFWHNSTSVPQVWTPSTNLKCPGKLESEIIATWLRDEMGLTSRNVQTFSMSFTLCTCNTTNLVLTIPSILWYRSTLALLMTHFWTWGRR